MRQSKIICLWAALRSELRRLGQLLRKVRGRQAWLRHPGAVEQFNQRIRFCLF
jgi:hypothetical protein